MATNQTQIGGFFIVLDGSQAGPFTEAELTSLRNGGRFTETTLVWKAGMSGWTKAAEVPVLSHWLATARTRSPEPAFPPPVPTAESRRTHRDSHTSEADELELEDDWFSSGQAASSHAAKSKRLDPFASLMLEAKKKQKGGNSYEESGPKFALSDGDGGADVAVGEQTRFFMIQAGMTQKQRNPPWKIALYVGSLLCIPLFFLFALSQIQVEQVYFDRETGQTEKVEVSALDEVSEGISDLKDKLLGVNKTDSQKEEEKSRRLSVIRKKALRLKKKKAKESQERMVIPEDVVMAEGGGTDGFGRMGGTVHTVSLNIGADQSDARRMAALNGDDDRILRKGPVPRKGTKSSTAATDGAPSLAPEVISKVVGDNQKAFSACVQNELRRNPAFKGEKIILTLTIGSSGMVTHAAIDKPEVDKAVVGNCIKMSARRFVFPSFEGDAFSVEFPLLLSAGF